MGQPAVGVGTDPNGQQTLPGLPGLMRSVRTPEFADMVFHEVRAKSVLNKVPGQSRMPFQWTVNPYRGCSHGCRYCLAGDTPVLMADGRTQAAGRAAGGRPDLRHRAARQPAPVRHHAGAGALDHGQAGLPGDVT